MKKIYIPFMALVCGMLQTACTCDSIAPAVQNGGVGEFALSLTADDIKTEVTTRAATVDVNTFKVSLKDKNSVSIIDGKAYGSLSEGDRTLPAGEGYHITVESCTLEESLTANDGWGAMRFTGEATFGIVSDQSTEVNITCQMTNAGLQLVFDPTFTTKFPVYAATTQNDSRSLVFKGTNPQAVAFYDAAGQSNPTVDLKITGSAGGWEDRVDMVKSVGLTAGKIKVLTVKYDENNGRVDIEFDTDNTTETDDSNDVTIQ